MSRLVYLGILIPLQLLFCGSLIYLSTYPSWLRWGAYLNPMHYFLAAIFVNEFHNNSSSIPSSSSHHYNDLKSQYGYQTNLLQSIILMACLGYLYKMLWLFSLKYRELWTVSTLPLKRAFRAAKKKMKRLMRAGLRFSKKRMRKIHEEGEGDGYGVLDEEEEELSHESGDEWRSEEDEEEREGVGKRGQKKPERKKEKPKKRKSLGEEMFVREDGLMLFGVMPPTAHHSAASGASSPPSRQPSTSSPSSRSQSHHSVLSALYRPEYLQGGAASSQTQSTNINTGGTSATPRISSTTSSKNRIVVSKSQRGSGGAGSGSSGDSLHSSLRI
jgi:hypothetical protein